LAEQEQDVDALRELRLGVEELLLGVGEALERDLRGGVVRDRLRRARVHLKRRVEARERLGEAALAEEELPLAVQRVDVARVALHRLTERLARLAGRP